MEAITYNSLQATIIRAEKQFETHNRLDKDLSARIESLLNQRTEQALGQKKADAVKHYIRGFYKLPIEKGVEEAVVLYAKQISDAAAWLARRAGFWLTVAIEAYRICLLIEELHQIDQMRQERPELEKSLSRLDLLSAVRSRCQLIVETIKEHSICVHTEITEYETSVQKILDQGRQLDTEVQQYLKQRSLKKETLSP